MSNRLFPMPPAGSLVAVVLGAIVVAACSGAAVDVLSPEGGAGNDSSMGDSSTGAAGAGSDARGGGGGASGGNTGAGGATSDASGTDATRDSSDSGATGAGGFAPIDSGAEGAVSTDGGAGPDSTSADAGPQEDIHGGADAGRSDAGTISDGSADVPDQSVEPDVAEPIDAPADLPFDWPTGNNAIDGSVSDAGSVSLPFDVRDAAYSRALDRMVIVSTTPIAALHIYDRESLADRWMQLPFDPASVAVSYDGLEAVIVGWTQGGSPSWLVHVDLTTLAVLNTCSVPRVVPSLAVWPNNNSAILGSWNTNENALSLSLDTCNTGDTGINAPGYGNISPDGNRYYLTANGPLQRFTSQAGGYRVEPFDVHSTSTFANRVWLSADESRIFGAPGERYRPENDVDRSLTYTGRLEGFTQTARSRVLTMVHTPALHQIAATVDNSFASPSEAQLDSGTLRIYDDVYLALQREIPLPQTGTYPNVEMRYGSLFQNNAATAYYVVGRPAAVNLPANIVRIPLAPFTSDAGGGQGGSGLPHLNGITAPAGSAVLPYEISDAEYDSSSNRIVFVSRRPENAVHAYDPETLVTTTTALPLFPTSIAVSPDGQFAAVGHEAWVSYVDLAHASVVWTCAVPTDVGDIVLPGNGFVYVLTGRNGDMRAYSIAVSDCTTRLGGIFGDLPYAKLTTTGDRIFNAGFNSMDELVLLPNGESGSRPYLCPTETLPNGRVWPRMIDATMFELIFGDGSVQNGTIEVLDLVNVGHLQSLGASVNNNLAELLRTKSGKLLTISAETLSAPDTDPRDTLIEVFDATTFAHDKTVTLPRFQRQGSPLLMHGQFVFERSDGTSYYAVLKSEPVAGVERDRAFGVVRLTP